MQNQINIEQKETETIESTNKRVSEISMKSNSMIDNAITRINGGETYQTPFSSILKIEEKIHGEDIIY